MKNVINVIIDVFTFHKRYQQTFEFLSSVKALIFQDFMKV